jgi:transposase
MSPSVSLPSRFIGCDVGKAEIVVFDQSLNQLCTIANEAAALDEFAAGLDETCLVVCEATGGYEAILLHALIRAGRAAHRADARKVKAFIRSFGTLGKTDAIDAKALARYGQERHQRLHRWNPPETEREQLHTLVMARRDFVTDHAAWRNRSKAPGANHAAGEISATIQTIEAQIEKLDDRINRLIQNSKTLACDVKTARSVPGIGRTIGPSLIALMPELGTLDRRQVAALAGAAPHPKQSGGTDAYRNIRGGRPEIKSILFMAALAASRSKSALGEFYKRLIQNGKKPIVALAALMRKIIVIVNAKIRDARLQLS